MNKEIEGRPISEQETITIESPDFSDLTHLSFKERIKLDKVIKMREDDAIMAEYVNQGLATFIGEMTGEEMDKKAKEEGWPSNWSTEHPIYDNNGNHQQRWKVYEFSQKLIDTESKINSGEELSEDEDFIRKKAEKICESIDEYFSPEDFYFRSAEVQKELIEQMVADGKAEYLGSYGQIEIYDKLPDFHPWNNSNEVRVATRKKTSTGDRIFDCYRLI